MGEYGLDMANIEQKIREMNREILRIKTSHPVKSNMKTFWGNYNFLQSSTLSTHTYEITYADGTQPILTIIANALNGNEFEVIFREPSGNKQIMIDTGGHHESDTRYTLLSTRQILGVRRLS